MVNALLKSGHQKLTRILYLIKTKNLWVGFSLFFIQIIIALLQNNIPFSDTINEISIYWVLILHIMISLLIIIIQLILIRLNKTEIALTSASKVKSEFLANISHELRTPLNSIIGFLEIVTDSDVSRLSSEQIELLQIISNSSKHLLDLINDIIQISRANSEEIELDKKECDIEILINKSVSFFQYKLKSHNFIIQNELEKKEHFIRVDHRLILQVLINLLGNAIKFTPLNNRIGIKIKKVMNYMEITVWDEGNGISPENIKKLFHPFCQLEQTYSKNNQGSGLGLFISKTIIERHGGKIHCKSVLGVTTQFIFTIPYEDKQLIIENKANELLDALWND